MSRRERPVAMGEPETARRRRLEVVPDPPPSPPAPARGQVRGASGLNFVAGIWLVISPHILGYDAGDVAWSQVLAGGLVAVLALSRMLGAFRESLFSSANAAIGIWLFISAFWLADSHQAFLNTLIASTVVFLSGVVSATVTDAAEGRFPGA